MGGKRNHAIYLLCLPVIMTRRRNAFLSGGSHYARLNVHLLNSNNVAPWCCCGWRNTEKLLLTEWLALALAENLHLVGAYSATARRRGMRFVPIVIGNNADGSTAEGVCHLRRNSPWWQDKCVKKKRVNKVFKAAKLSLEEGFAVTVCYRDADS